MHLDNMIRLSLVSVSYIILIFGLAFLMLKPFAKKKSLPDKILFYFIVGNFYVMNVIFLLLFFRCTSRAITIIVLLMGAIGIRILSNRNAFMRAVSERVEVFALLTKGVYGWKFFCRDRIARAYNRTKNISNKILRQHLIEGVLLLACFGIYAYYIGYRYVCYSTLGIYDETVHLTWIQYMLKGEIFYDGVYPFGFHNIVYAIIKVFGFPAYTVGRYFGFIMVLFLLLMLWLLLKKVYRSSYAPLIGLFLYVGADVFTDAAWDRLLFSLPQEFGILFIYPMVITLYQYICNKKKEDLWLFVLCFASTLYVHYYVTIIALLLCFCIGISGFYRIIRGKMFFKLILYGVMGTLIGILPMGIGVLTGHELQGSLYWAIGVIQGTSKEEEETQPDTEQTQDQYEIVQGKGLFETGKSIVTIIKDRTITYLMKSIIFYLLILSMILVLIKTFLHILIRSKRNETFLQFGLMLYGAALLILLCSKQLGYPVIMEDYRVSEFLAYAVPLLLGISLEYIFEIFERWEWARWAVNIGILVIACYVVFFVYANGFMRHLGRFTLMHSESSVDTIYNIMEQNKKNTWTVVSTVDEYSIIMDSGFHYEWSDFLLQLENYQEDSDSTLYIPTENIFFFIEKKPIHYGEIINLEKGIGAYAPFTQEDAMTNLSSDFLDEPSQYYKQQRDTIMAKAYYWAKKYMYYFPNEMSVFYEDDSFVCYQLKQNSYYLNNLEIDYGYNKN